MQVEVVYEKQRGCGYRKPSKDGVGIYLRGFGKFEDCERLPFLLDVCPCCGTGFTSTRGFTWINPMSLFDPYMEPRCIATYYKEDASHDHERCWLCNPELLGSKAGLLWIGEQHYKTPREFIREAASMGISRKIAAIPNGFEVGEHAIFLAHRKAVQVRNDKGELIWKPSVFMAFKPHLVELIIDDPDDVPDKAIEIAKRLGEDKVRILKVIPDKEGETEDALEDWGEF